MNVVMAVRSYNTPCHCVTVFTYACIYSSCHSSSQNYTQSRLVKQFYHVLWVFKASFCA